MGSTRAPAPASLSGVEALKQAAARAAAELVSDGEKVGLGTGTTVAHLLPALAARGLSIRCVATSPATEQVARKLGLELAELDELAPLDIAIDGADQIDPAGWLVKGGGGAHTREKIVAAAARRFVVIASAEKAVPKLGPPVPLELMRFGAHTTLASLGEARLRDAPPSPEGNLIADYFGPVEDPRALAARLSSTPGVVGHGLFAPEMIADILIAGTAGIEHRTLGQGADR
ncbi:MAG: ribose-5-phosphate isomerase RpiA [Solirubrobacteraceae bacterium]